MSTTHDKEKERV